MPSPSRNLDALRAWSDRLRTRVAPDAVRAGLDVFAAGISARAKGRARIGRSRIVVGPEKVSGGVVYIHRRALPVVRATIETDGDAALQAMTDTLKRGL